MPATAPLERPVRGTTVLVDVDVTVADAVVITIGGRVCVGGMSMEEHAVKLDERQQKEVAFGEVCPQ
jgi:hypothetical protein